jgi:hypothetical protein
VRFETTAATVRALSGSVGGMMLDVSPEGGASPRTELLDATPVPPTRTRAPVTPSETPSSRKRSLAFQAAEPIPDFRGRARFAPWLVLAAVGLVIGLFVTLSRDPRAPSAATPASPRPLATTRSAARPAPTVPLTAAAEVPPPKHSTGVVEAPATRSKAAKTGTDRRQPSAEAASAGASEPPPQAPAPARAESAPAKRPAGSGAALPGSGL